MRFFNIFRRPEQKRAEVSKLRTVDTRPDRAAPPPVSVLEELRHDDEIIPLVVHQHYPTVTTTHAQPAIPDYQVMGPATCHYCDAELELVCPNGHGGADQVLKDLTASRAAPPVSEKRPARKLAGAKGSKPPLVCACGAVVPRRRGRAPAIPQCENCKAKRVAA